MKPIKVCEKNAFAIEAALRQANGKAVAHTFTTYAEIAKMAEFAERIAYALLGTKAAAIGAKAIAQSGEKLPNAYKWTPIITSVTLEKKSTGWFLLSANSIETHFGGKRVCIFLTPAQKDMAISKFKLNFEVQQ